MPRRKTTIKLITRLPFGKDDEFTLYIKDSSGNWINYTDYIDKHNIDMSMNSVREASFQLIDIGSSERDVVKELAEVMFFIGENNLFFKGRIQKVEYASDGVCGVQVLGTEVNLRDWEVETLSGASGSTKRQLYEDVAFRTIIKELASETGDGSTPWIIETGDSYIDAYGNLTMRFENVDRLTCVAKTCDSVNYDWSVRTPNYPFDSDYLYCESHRGSQTSVYTFNTTGANPTALITSREKDVDNIFNDVTLLGRGDGDSQITSNVYAASKVYSKITTKVNSYDTSITVADASSFPASGTIQIGEETITYVSITGNTFNVTKETGTAESGSDDTLTDTDKSWTIDAYAGKEVYIVSGTGSGQSRTVFSNTSNTLTVGQKWDTNPSSDSVYEIATGRGTSSTTAIDHFVNVLVFKYYSKTSPESDSSLDIYGRKSKTIYNPDIISTSQAELVASRYLEDHMTPPVRIVVQPYSELDVLNSINLGDVVTVTDSDAGTSDDYRCVRIKYSYDNGNETVNFELGNLKQRYVSSVQNAVNTNTKTGTAMQGSTFFYTTGETENCDATHGVDIDFRLPDDVVEVNKLLLDYSVSAPRVYSVASASGGASHRHDIDGEATNAGTGDKFSLFAVFPPYYAQSGHYHNNAIYDGTSSYPMYFNAQSPTKFLSDGSSGTIKTGTAYPNMVSWSDANISFEMPSTSKVSGTLDRIAFTIFMLNGNLGTTTFTYEIRDNNNWGNNDSHRILYGSKSVDNGKIHVDYEPTTIDYRGDDIYVKIDPGGTISSDEYWLGGIMVDINTKHSHVIDGITTEYKTASHSHALTYAISERATTGTTMKVEIDGVDRTNDLSISDLSDQEGLDIKDYLKEPLAGQKHTITLTPNGDRRIKADLYIKGFTEAKS
ncbi:MAG: hypothetical protein DRP29_03065 [Thermodesulfobacteriota bacterium]|nr:MAG: hypothetical protein DRP29_03065 [Thermodesulfobacteriota bacterium]